MDKLFVSETKNDSFPEVSLAYISLRKTSELCKQQLREEFQPMADEFNNAFLDTVKYLAEKEGTLNDKYLFLWNTNGSDIGRSSEGVFLYWGEPKNKLLFVPSLAYNGKSENSLTNLQIHSGWDGAKDVIPDPVNEFDPFVPICVKKIDLLRGYKEKYGGDIDFIGLFTKLEEVGIKADDSIKTIKGRLSLQIKNRVEQLVDSVSRTTFIKGQLLPKILSPAEDWPVRNDKNRGLFFIPKEKRLVWAPLLKHDGQYLSKALPDLKKAVDANDSDWFEIADNVSWGLIENLKKTGWNVPRIIHN